MMARPHVLASTLLGMLSAPLVAAVAPSYAPHTTWDLAAFSVACGGAGLLPDLDHRGSTAARSLGVVTEVIARGIAAVSGGHRQATHSLVAVLATTAVAGIMGDHGGWTAWVPLAILVGLAAAGLGVSHAPAVMVATGLLIMQGGIWTGTDIGPWLGLAVGVGYAGHLVADCATVQGCPLLWPNPYRHRYADLRTGGPSEPWITAALAFGITAMVWLS